jgi:hypothetical protein
VARKRRNKDDDDAFEEADLAVAELADGAFDAAFDAVTMDEDAEDAFDLTAPPPGDHSESDSDSDGDDAGGAAEPASYAGGGSAPTRAELETGVGLEAPPEDSNEGDAEESTLDLPPAAEERSPPAAAAPVEDPPYLAPEAPAAASARPETIEEDAVQGRLEQLRLVEIVQMMEFGKKSAWVEVEPEEGGHGELGFDNGQCVWAIFGDVVSDEGFCSLCEVKVGKFKIFYGRAPEQTNVESPTQFLLLEALRRIDEGNRDGDLDEEAELEKAFMMDSDPDAGQ